MQDTHHHDDNTTIEIHGEESFVAMRKAGRLAAELLDYITPFIVPGARTGDLDDLCNAFTVERGGISAPLGYRGYPRATCMSINHVVCHGIPGDKKLEEGDIVNIDVTPKLDGWHGDSSRMFIVGEANVLARRLVNTTYEALRAGIRQVRPGATLGDVGHAIQTVAQAAGFSIVREYGGHGIGDIYHDAPHVNHFGRPGEGLKLEEGMIFTIEPMLNAGAAGIRELNDGWTVVTRDHSLSAQFEHMVTVTADGFEVLTPWPDGLGDYSAID